MKRLLKKIVCFLEKYEILTFGKNNKTLIFLMLCLILGMVLGVLSIYSVSIESIKNLDFLFFSDFKERINQTGFDAFVSSFCASFIFALAIEFSSLSFWGTAVIPLIILFRSFGLGLTAGYLYLIYELQGIAFYILILLPGIFVSSIGLILFSVEAIKFSIQFSKKIFPNANNERLWEKFIYHLKKSGYCLTLLCVSSIIDFCFFMMFSRFFKF